MPNYKTIGIKLDQLDTLFESDQKAYEQLMKYEHELVDGYGGDMVVFSRVPKTLWKDVFDYESYSMDSESTMK